MQQSNKALLLMLGSTICLTIMNLLIKLMPGVPAVELVFIRSVIGAIGAAFLLKYSKMSFVPNKPAYLILVTLTFMSSMLLYYYTLQKMTLGMALSLRYLFPFIVMIIAVLFLNEKVKIMQWLSALLVIAGLVLFKGFSTDVALPIFFCGVAGAIFSALSYLFIKKASEFDHPLVILNFGFFLTVFILLPFAYQQWTPLNNSEIIYVTAMSVVAFFGSIMVIYALQMGEASKVAPVKYVEVLAAFIIGFFFFNETFSSLSLCGVALIFTGLLANVYFQNNKET